MFPGLGNDLGGRLLSPDQHHGSDPGDNRSPDDLDVAQTRQQDRVVILPGQHVTHQVACSARLDMHMELILSHDNFGTEQVSDLR